MTSFTSFRFLRAGALALLLAAAVADAAAQTTNRTNRTNTNRTNPSRTTTGTRTTGTGGTGNRSSSSSSIYPNATELGTAMITSDSETRRIIVVTDEETNASIKNIIASLDKPKPQVLINVVFLQITHNKDLDLGAEFNYSGPLLGGHTTESTLSKFGLSAASNGMFYNLTKNDLTATIRALATVGKTEILSRPSILARSSQQATIMVGQEVPFITNSRISDTGVTTNTVQYQDIGIILRVTPFITSDGLVEMIVTPEISALSEKTVAISDNATTPVIDKRSADTVVVTPNDRTVVIGGLISDQTTDQVNKIPILGDIPLLGAAFRHKVKSTAKTELMIFLTPHVVQNPDALAGLADEERARLQMKPETFEEGQVDTLIKKP